MSGPEVRAENVTIRCGLCETITEVGLIEGPRSDHTENVFCSGCKEPHTVRLEVEA